MSAQKIDYNIEFDLLNYILSKENYAVYGFHNIENGVYTLNKCPICGMNKPHFKIYDRDTCGTSGYLWASECTTGKKERAVKFIEIYRHYGDWFSANNYCREFIKNEKNKELEKENSIYEVNEKGEILKKWENMKILLNKHNIECRYNEMKKEIEFCGVKHDHQMVDSTFTRINSLCVDENFKLSKDQLYDFILCVASENKYNPITIYLNGCKEQYGDSTGELSRLLGTIKYNVCDNERIQFYNKMVTKWLMNCANIAFNDYEKELTMEFVLTFHGKQGLGKSKWLKSIVPKGFFGSDIILDLDNKDKIIEVLKYWIVELGELSGTFKKSDMNKLKAFITSMRDTYRNPYGRSASMYPRRTAFSATVNDSEFLVDKTGNRRFAVLPVSSLDYKHDINIDAVWGEVMMLRDEYIMEDKPIYMTHEEQELNDIYNAQFVSKTDTQIALEEVFDFDSTDEFGACTISMLCKYMADNYKKHYSENAIKRTLNEMGYDLENGGKPMMAGLKGRRIKGRFYKLPYVEGLTLPF